jgi:hypothetical protein
VSAYAQMTAAQAKRDEANWLEREALEQSVRAAQLPDHSSIRMALFAAANDLWQRAGVCREMALELQNAAYGAMR